MKRCDDHIDILKLDQVAREHGLRVEVVASRRLALLDPSDPGSGCRPIVAMRLSRRDGVIVETEKADGVDDLPRAARALRSLVASQPEDRAA